VSTQETSIKSQEKEQLFAPARHALQLGPSGDVMHSPRQNWVKQAMSAS
jgi:hypothetical protein